MAMHLNSDNFNQVISKGKVMVDFWAPWCMPCQSLLPVIDELSGELEGKAVVAKVNVDENKPIAREYGVMSIPTVVFFVDGVEKERLVGEQPKQTYLNIINSLKKRFTVYKRKATVQLHSRLPFIVNYRKVSARECQSKFLHPGFCCRAASGKSVELLRWRQSARPGW